MNREVSVTLAATLPLVYACFTQPLLLGIPVGVCAATRILPLLEIHIERVEWDEAGEKAKLGAILAAAFFSISPWCTPLCLLSLKITYLHKYGSYLLLFACTSPIDLLLFILWARCDAFQPDGDRHRVQKLLYKSAQDCILMFTLGTHTMSLWTRLCILFFTVCACSLAWKDKLPDIRRAAEGIYTL